MITKTKTIISINKDVMKDARLLCSAMSMKLSTFTENLYKAFINSEKRPKESIEQLAARIKKEYESSVKRDNIVIF